MALPAGRYGVTKRQLNKVKNLPVNTIGMIEETAQQIYEDNGALGSKNLLDNVATSYERNGITWTVNSDGTVKVNGTATAHESQAVISSEDLMSLLNTYGDLILTGCPSGGGDNTYQMFVSASGEYEYDRGEGLLLSKSKTYTSIQMQIRNGYTADNVVFKPMLRLASDTDPTYRSHVETNLQLTQNKADITALGTNEGATASRLYHPGEHFYKDGKFCTVIGSGDVAADSTWTLNTNYVEDTIAELLITQKASFEYTVNVSGVTNSGVTKFGKVVCGQIQFKIDSTTVDTPILCFTLPSGFRPASIVYGSTTDVGSNSTNEKHQFEINTNGAVNVILRNEHDAFRWVAFNFVYITA